MISLLLSRKFIALLNDMGIWLNLGVSFFITATSKPVHAKLLICSFSHFIFQPFILFFTLSHHIPRGTNFDGENFDFDIDESFSITSQLLFPGMLEESCLSGCIFFMKDIVCIKLGINYSRDFRIMPQHIYNTHVSV